MEHPATGAKVLGSKASWKPVSPQERWDSVEQYIIYLRHMAAYIFAEDLASKTSLLEIGCGTGYGADHLSQFSTDVIAIDIWKEGISNCHARYKKENLTFMLADGLRMPFRELSFGTVISCQVLEHIDPEQCLIYLSEAKRVLKRKGTFLVTTPNSKLRLLPFQRPWNPQHKKEYDCEQLQRLLSRAFKKVQLYGLVGTEEIQSIEQSRVRQSPLLIYMSAPFMPLMNKLLPACILLKLKKAVDSVKSRKIINQFQMKKLHKGFSVGDFKVSPNCARNCIDIYAVCAKTNFLCHNAS